MSIGLCCASMPALSKLLGHHIDYARLKSWVESRYDSFKSKNSKNSFSKYILYNRRETPTKSRDSYINMEEATKGALIQTPYPCLMNKHDERDLSDLDPGWEDRFSQS